MLFDLVLSRDSKGNYELFYAPYYCGPKTGEWFNIGDSEHLNVRKSDRTYSGIQRDSELWEIIEDLAGLEAQPIYSKIEEWVLDYGKGREEAF